MMVAVGPYAPSDGIDYSPLSDLIKVINRDKPDCCVLVGEKIKLRIQSHVIEAIWKWKQMINLLLEEKEL